MGPTNCGLVSGFVLIVLVVRIDEFDQRNGEMKRIMSKSMLGLDIGNSTIKFAVADGQQVRQMVCLPLLEDLVKEDRIVSREAIAQELRQAIKDHRISSRRVALTLPSERTIVRRMVVPYMTEEQLRINLPYEFHDFIQEDKDLFFYDYAVAGVQRNEQNQPTGLELIGCAVRRETIEVFRDVLRMAGLKLERAVPDCLVYGNLIRNYEGNYTGHPAEYCIVDMGHRAIRMHMFRGHVYETTRVIDIGGRSIDTLIASHFGVDPHLAASYKQTNYENAQTISACQELYSRVAVELMRAVNFYGFNTPNSDLRDIYFCGGLTNIRPLMDEISHNVDLEMHSITELLPPGGSEEDAVICATAVGSLLQGNGR